MKKTVLVTAAAMAFIALLASGCGSTQVSQAPKSNQPPGLAGATHPSSEKAIPGVIDVGPKVSPQEVATKLFKGKTTLDEVIALLGPTPNIAMGSDGGRRVVYNWSKRLQDEPVIDMKEITMSSLPGPFALLSLRGDMAKIKELKAATAAVRDSFRSLTMDFESKDGILVLKDYQFSPPLKDLASADSKSPSLVSVAPSR